MGKDGLASLLKMLNCIKNELLIPTSLNLSNVSTIYKGKGSRQEVINLRGIFKLPIVRNILDRLVYFDEQDELGKSMGQFQVGNQKERNIRDHTLVIHAIVNDAIETKVDIDIQFTDIKQCFDALWLDEAINDLYDSGIASRNLNLLYEGNRKTRMCVETNFGRSPRVELQKVVMQGSVPGGMICSNQLSKLCNRMYKEGHVYMYRNKIAIPALAMVDDIASVAMCNSIEAINNNIVTDSFVQRKKLEGQTGAGKCQCIHIGPDECRSKYWVNSQTVTNAESYKYLGDHVSDGWETLYSKRTEKAQGYSATCLAMCTEISLGIKLYETAKLLHSAIFVNGTLLNMETWPKCTELRISKMERIEQNFMRRILKAHSKTPIEALYLELGYIPLRFHLMKKRVMYLSDIMKREENELTRRLIEVQKERGVDIGDFYDQAKSDQDRLHVTNEMMLGSKETLKKEIKKNLDTLAFQFLINKARSHTKMNDEAYTSCEGAACYNDSRFTPDMLSLLFKFRTRTFLVKNNFRNNYKNTNILCPLCEKFDDSQEHLFDCEKIKERCQNTDEYKLKDIFTDDTQKLYNTTKKLIEIVKIRDTIINPEE